MLGLATIGQSPRDDVVPSMFGTPSPTMPQAGALDGLTPSQVAELAPGPDEHPLVTRLRDGSEVVIAKERVTPLLEAAIARLEDQGANIVCVLCTGEFVDISSVARIVYPDRVLAGVIDAVLPSGTIGAIVPHEGQRQSMIAKWSGRARAVEIATVSPYSGGATFGDAAAALERAGAELIVMDCMGYSLEMQSKAQTAVTVPVILANRVVGAVLSALVPSLAGQLEHPVRL